MRRQIRTRGGYCGNLKRNCKRIVKAVKTGEYIANHIYANVWIDLIWAWTVGHVLNRVILHLHHMKNDGGERSAIFLHIPRRFFIFIRKAVRIAGRKIIKQAIFESLYLMHCRNEKSVLLLGRVVYEI